MADFDWYAGVFQATSSGIFIYSETGELLDVNPAGCRLHQRTREEMLAMSPTEFIHPDTHHIFAEFRQAVLQGREYLGEAKGLRKDGTTFDVEVYGSAIVIDGVTCLFSSLIDVSERNELRTRLEDKNRMEAVGRLAGGVAHDFNNLLTVILGNADLASRGHSPELLADALGQIKIASRRAQELTQQLLAFGRRQALLVQTVNLHESIRRVDSMLSRIMRENINATLELQAETSLVQVDVAQLDQVIMNLIINAQDAMPSGGNLRIATTLREVARGELHDGDNLNPGRYISFSVTDEGHGIAESDLPHLFEPFFTTKPVGKGTGLGLATVYGIVRQHGGTILVRSQPGVGSTFEVLLPPCDKPSLLNVAPAAPDQGPHQVTRFHGEQVLIVDDDYQLLHFVASCLTRAGCSIFTAATADEALRIAHERVLDLLITDVIMPTMNGQELFGELAKAQSTLRVMYMSGYTDAIVNRNTLAEEGVQFLAKPFDIETLTRSVRVALDGRGAAT